MLTGMVQRVVCRLGHIFDRETFQDWLSLANPKWKAFADEMERTGAKLRTNHDGDVAIEHLGISYESFVVPDCPHCSSEKNMSVFVSCLPR